MKTHQTQKTSLTTRMTGTYRKPVKRQQPTPAQVPRKPDEYELGPDCDSGCLDQGVRVCGHEFSMKHHLDDSKQTETQRKPDPASHVAGHSPLPWGFGKSSRQIFSKATGAHVATLHATPLLFPAEKAAPTIEQAEANAAFIVRACNHAQRLADALRNLEAELQMAFDDVPAGVDAWMATARQALAQWNEGK